MWRADAVDLVDRFTRAKAGQGSESFPPWRIGYMAGLSDVKETVAGYEATMQRTAPNNSVERVSIPVGRPPAGTLLDRLCWHFEQDVARYSEYERDVDDPWWLLPAKTLLVDPVTATLLAGAGIDEIGLRQRVVDNEHVATRRDLAVRLDARLGVHSFTASFHMNEMRAVYRLPESKAQWRKGVLEVEGHHVPETLKAAARGRPLRDLVSHPLLDHHEDLLVTSVTETAGKLRIRTTATSPEGMRAVPPRHKEVTR
jgi:hypothetical protein